ncbi:hypothetical protein HNY73_005906 [Argiope bruennichi]|uniref:Uncharacterized protein n=1 Tax=Argiope bruennichi TaxID=94029 RepID=A0A8T0FI81_ARGBR|nr:hypothetical protein HNY73_005906 [Argiope bruennichi]
MTKLNGVLSLILVLTFIAMTEAVTPIFLQAITSALATIPFSGGPMTTGLIGAKLGIGTKLLYYLGYFGQGSKRTSPPKPSPKLPKAKITPKLPEGLQPLPLPYALSGGGGFQQMGGGFGGPANFQQMPFAGFEPSQVFQALRAQGYDANTAMQIMNYGAGYGMNSGAGGFGMNIGGFGMNAGGFAPNMPNFPPNMGSGGFGQNIPGFSNGMGGGFNPGSTGFPAGTPQGAFPPGFQPVSNEGADVEANADIGMGEDAQPSSNAEGESSEEPNDVESFFKFLQDMDDNGCISRLICDIGADPKFLGEFSENIHGIVGSLDVQPSSRAYPYVQIMESGKEGGCSAKFPQCGDMAYGIVKSIAPTVGIPQDINLEAVNNL